MADICWTKEQFQAIEAQGGDILVTAAAGSGKTAVLVERVVAAITRQENPVEADRLLIVTFSNAAAEEMRQRISHRIWELIQQNPSNHRLARQQLLLESAHISTIHSFCIFLLRSYFHELGIPADFRIAEEQELRVLETRILREILEKEYSKGESSFFDLVELFSSTRSDSNLERTILRLYEFIRNHPFYHQWMDRMEAQYDVGQPLEATLWGEILLNYAKGALDYCNRLLEDVQVILAEDEALSVAYGKAFAADEEILATCRRGVENRDWDTCHQTFAQMIFIPLGRIQRGYPDEAKKNLVKGRRDEIKKLLTTLRDGPFSLTREDYARDTAQLHPMISHLFGIVKAFDRELSVAKLDRSLLDFGDLEHYTLSLLYREKAGIYIRSETALQIAQKFDEVLVDEYQDTNHVQEMIFNALDQPGGNRFMVGDVKQSIYRFRHARPEIFLKKKNTFSFYEEGKFPAKISLQANFRTRPEITGTINYLFSMLMSPTVGEMNYEKEDWLKSKASYPHDPECALRFHLLDMPKGTSKEEGRRAEAQWVAQEIVRLLQSGTMVTTTEGSRPLELGDVCILLRSPRRRGEIFEQELAAVGLKSWIDHQGGFLEAKEVAPILSYLRILGNPLLDLELAKVLCSPLYGFTTQQMAALRIERKGESLFMALGEEAATQEGPCRCFWEDYHYLRKMAATVPADQVLEQMYQRTGALHKVMALPQGESHQANLRLLAEYAADYQQGSGGVDGFAAYLSALEEYGYDLPPASVSGQGSVSIMSVHKSKGLEFPIVFFCDTAAQFNMMDLSADTLLHPDFGFACILRDNRRMRQHKTIPYLAMAVENRRAMLSEELRILYVALTRARERLYITASDNGLAYLPIAAAKPLKEGALDPWAVLGSGSLYHWLAGAFVYHRDFDPTLLEGTILPAVSKKSEGSLRVTTSLPSTLSQREPTHQEIDKSSVPDDAEVARLRNIIAWQYPYQGDIVTPAKLSVSQLSRGETEDKHFFARRPKALTRQSLTSAERGIAAHKFMQFANFAAAADQPEQEITRLQAHGFLSEEESGAIDSQVICQFFQSSLGKRILAAKHVYREIRFLREFTPLELERIDPDFRVLGNTVVQGVADCVFLEGDRGIVVDYKTDLVKEPQTLRQRYTSQLRLYKAILEDYLNIDIEEMFLYSFALSQEILVDGG